MKLQIHLEEGDTGSPIEIANAIIKHYMNRALMCASEDLDIDQLRQLDGVAEHIKVYVNHYYLQGWR